MKSRWGGEWLTANGSRIKMAEFISKASGAANPQTTTNVNDDKQTENEVTPAKINSSMNHPSFILFIHTFYSPFVYPLSTWFL